MFAVAAQAQTSFDTVVVDPAGPRAPWGKAAADMNGDGLTDIIVAGHQRRKLSLSERVRSKLGLFDVKSQLGQLIWYEAPDWTPHVVAEDQAFRTDVAAADVNGDGAADLVAVADSGVWLYTAPDWSARRIDERKFHDVILADLYGDATPEIVLRNQSLFGYRNGDALAIYTSTPSTDWSRDTVDVAHGEGLAVADMDGDGRRDIVVNAQILLNRGPGRWARVTYAQEVWPDVTIAVGDFNADGRPDVALAPAEQKGQRHRISWFAAPGNPGDPWQEFVVLPDVEAVHHALVAADFDRDGRMDLATARMNQGDDPDAVLMLRNLDTGVSWSTLIAGTDGSHNLQVLDADGDFDADVFGANWQRDNYSGDYPVTLWRNTLPPREWRRVVIDQDRPGQATGIFAGDLDGDGWNDLVTGAYAYSNPGSLDGTWVRRPLGDGANNAIALTDVDADSDLDVLANGWAGYAKPSFIDRALGKLGLGDDPWGGSANSLVLATNDDGAWSAATVVDRLPGDWVHGAVVDEASSRLLLSMHQQDTSPYAVTLPGAEDGPWKVQAVPGQSENEALSLADMDRDGRPDLVTGTTWIAGDGAGTVRFHDADRPVDRHTVVDMNGDGQPDVVVGYESPDRAAVVAWYERDGANEPWTEHVIGHLAGPMSLDAGDVDLDGDIDVVVGEHRLDHPDRARLVLFENVDGQAQRWRAHRMSMGDEHHDGARLVDLDGDGDLDVASIGWTHGRVLVFENPSVNQ
ncbi:MAG: VCBS repeat-containing protein [Pseudomonadota bacterium]